MAQSSQSAWQQLGSAHTHRARPLATVPQATPGALSFYPPGKAPPIAVNIAKLPELLRKAALDLAHQQAASILRGSVDQMTEMN